MGYGEKGGYGKNSPTTCPLLEKPSDFRCLFGWGGDGCFLFQALWDTSNTSQGGIQRGFTRGSALAPSGHVPNLETQAAEMLFGFV